MRMCMPEACDATPPILLAVFGRPTVIFGSIVKYFPCKRSFWGVSKPWAPEDNQPLPQFLLSKSISPRFTCCISLTMQEKHRSGTPNDTDATRTSGGRIIFVFRMQMRSRGRWIILLWILVVRCYLVKKNQSRTYSTLKHFMLFWVRKKSTVNLPNLCNHLDSWQLVRPARSSPHHFSSINEPEYIVPNASSFSAADMATDAILFSLLYLPPPQRDVGKEGNH